MKVVCLHNVLKELDDEFDKKCSRISVAEFEAFLDRVEIEFKIVGMEQALTWLEKKECHPEAVVLTFDDGFLGVVEHAFPTLKRRGHLASVFYNPPQLVSGPKRLFHFLEIEIAFRIGRSSAFVFQGESLSLESSKDRLKSMRTFKKSLKQMPEEVRSAEHNRLLKELNLTVEEISSFAQEHFKYKVMNTDQAKALEACGWTSGPHSMTHRSLGNMPIAEAETEMRESKRLLESLLGHPCQTFAYPYGELAHVGVHAPRIAEKIGFHYAFSTLHGELEMNQDLYMLPRYDYKDFCKVILNWTRP